MLLSLLKFVLSNFKLVFVELSVFLGAYALDFAFPELVEKAT
jgi:hypothetical protein